MIWVLAVLIFSAALAPGAVPAARKARRVLTNASTQGDQNARLQLAVALSLVNSSDPSTALLDSLVNDKDYLVREAAIATIGELGAISRAPLIRARLQDDVPEVGFAAARALYKLHQPEGRQVLESIVQKETRAESEYFRERFRSMMRQMKTPKSALLFTVSQGIGFVPVPGVGEGVSAINAILLDENFSARASALGILARDNSAEVTKLILESLSDGDWSVRATAVQALAWRQAPALRDRLVPMFEDRNNKVRYRAAACWLRLDYLAGHRAKQPK
jgi:HEAT repeat protein